MKDTVEDVIEDGVTGLIVPERDPVALAAAIQRLADDPALRGRMGPRRRSGICGSLIRAAPRRGVGDLSAGVA